MNMLEVFKSNLKESVEQGRTFNIDHFIKYNLCNDEELKNINHWYEQISLKKLLLLANKDFLEEIICHDHKNITMITKNSKTKQANPEQLSLADWELALKYLTLKNSIQWNYSKPFCSFHMTSSIDLRVSLIHKASTGNNRPKVFFRIIRPASINLASFQLASRHEKIINQLVQNKKNILISGATGSGKTSFLRSLLNHNGEFNQEHIITIEDTQELFLENSNTTSLIAKQSQGFTMEDYCSYSMRMRPDRLILGEIRSKEVVPLLLSLNNGHEGLLSTIHANSARDALLRMATLFQVYTPKELCFEIVMKLLVQGIHYIIHLEDKKVTQIIKILGQEDGQPFFENLFEDYSYDAISISK